MAATETIKMPLKILLPRIVPRPTSSCPRSFAMTIVASSGTDVPTATIVAPIMNSSMPKEMAMPLAPATIRFPAATRKAKPTTQERTTIHLRYSPRTSSAALRCFRASIIAATSQARNMLNIRKPSTRESSPSRNRTPVIMGINNATGKSRFTLSRGLWIPEITKARPRIRATFTTLLPRASPRAIWGVPARAAFIETDNSGLDVANAATVAPIMPGEIRAQ